MKSLSELRQMVDDSYPRDGETISGGHRKMADAFILLAREMLYRIEAMDERLAQITDHRSYVVVSAAVGGGGGGGVGDTTRSYGPPEARCYDCWKPKHEGACR